MKKISAVVVVLACIFMIYPFAFAQKEIRIGAIYPLTGSQQGMGRVMLEGARLAADIINTGKEADLFFAERKGFSRLRGAKIKIIPADHHMDIRTGMTEAERLIKNEKVVAVIGCYNSGITEPVSAVVERLGVPFINDSSTAPSLSDRGFKWFFSITPDEEILSNNFFVFLNELKSRKKINADSLAIFTERSLFGTESAQQQLKYAEQYGYRVLGTVVYPANTATLTAQVQKLKSYNPSILIQNSYAAEAILAMRTYREIDFTPDALLANANGFVVPAFVKTLGKDADFIISRERWAEDLAATNPLLKSIADRFKMRTGEPMNGNSALSFTAVIVLADAISRAGSVRPDKIQKALLKTNLKSDQIIMPWEGVRFDPRTHENVLAKGIIVQIQEGEYRTIWPSNLATKDVVWPMPKWDKR
jgi:branched-chain amino acid transport system substrate-binding protein